MTHDTSHETQDTWGGGEHSLNISATYLLRFGRASDLKMFPQRITVLMNYLFSKKGVCRTAPATLGVLQITYICLFLLFLFTG